MPFAPFIRSAAAVTRPFHVLTRGAVIGAALAASIPCAALASVVAAQPGGAGPTRPVRIDDLMHLRSVDAIDVTPDGRRIVFSVSGPEWVGLAPGEEPSAATESAYRSRLRLAMQDDEGAWSTRPLTSGAVRDRSPVLSPDGRRVAFMRAGAVGEAWDGRDGAEPASGTASQVWILELDGGEARQVTWFRDGCSRPRWSPDGRRLLVSVSIPADEIESARPWSDPAPGVDARDEAAGAGDEADPVAAVPIGTRRDLRRWLDARAKDADPRVIDRLDFQGELGLAGGIRYARVAVVSLEPASDGAPSSVRWATRGHVDARQPQWTADGTGILYAGPADETEYPDAVRRRAIYRCDPDGLGVTALVQLEDWTLGAPAPGPGGSIVFTAQRLDHPSDRQTRLGRVEADAIESGAVREEAGVRWLTDEAFDRSVRSWRVDGGRILLTAPDRGGVPLVAAGLGSLAPVDIVRERGGYPVGVGAFDQGGETLAWAETHPTNPSVLRVRTEAGESVVHDPNPWIADRAIAMPVRGLVTRPDGLEVEYWTLEPPARRDRERVPVVLQIHGGPSAMWGPGERSMWHEFQVLAGWGYGVVYANPRGSGGYGYEFQRANFQDWGQGPAGDVLAALDEAVAMDWMDAERLVVTGGSYGGYLTAWIVGNDDRFRAAVAQRGVYDLRTFHGEGNAWRLLAWEMGGDPWESRLDVVLRRESPITYVGRMRTPLLIMHGDRDLRTGVSQSEMLYRALRVLGRPVEYVRYPGTGHDLSRTGDPLRRMDRLGRIVEFFERFSDNAASAPRR